MKNSLLVLVLGIILFSACSEKSAYHYPGTSGMKVGGLLGRSLDSSANGRLKFFISDSSSEAIRIYHRDTAHNSSQLGWKGECAGKWLYAASLCFIRTGDTAIKNNLRNVADFLIANQAENGYIGTFNDTNRFCGNPVIPNQTFDLWMNGYIMQGLIELYKVIPDKKYITALKKLAGLIIETYKPGNKKIVNAGPFSGMAAACVSEHFSDLYELTGDRQYLDFAGFCLQELDERPGTEILSRGKQHYDVAQIGEGKMYEMLHCVVGAARLFRHTGKKKYLEAAENIWTEVYTHHQNAAGAPCGGVGIHPECFNVGYMFSPYFNSETCAMMDYLRLTSELLAITGEAKYAQQIEKITYNAITGAQFPDGYGWLYHSIMNGCRNRTGEFACCSSSGTVVLEEVPRTLYSANDNGIRINVYCESSATLKKGDNTVCVTQHTDYPFSGKIKLCIEPETEETFSVDIRIPDWIQDSSVVINGNASAVKKNTYFRITQKWKKHDSITIDFPIGLYLDHKTEAYNQRGEFIDIPRHYAALYRGPLLYGTQWQDEYKKPAPVSVPSSISANDFTEIPTPEGYSGKSYLLKTKDTSYTFVPFYQIGLRQNNIYRTVWLKKQSQ